MVNFHIQLVKVQNSYLNLCTLVTIFKKIHGILRLKENRVKTATREQQSSIALY